MLGSGASKVLNRVPSNQASAAASDIEEVAVEVPAPVPVPAYDTGYLAEGVTKAVGVTP